MESRDNFIITTDDLAEAGGFKRSLAPCPFCGRAPVIAARTYPDKGNVVYSVTCGECILTMSSCYKIGQEDKAREVVVNRWNTRAFGSSHGG